jgi:carboxyl-terminal processing protease
MFRKLSWLLLAFAALVQAASPDAGAPIQVLQPLPQQPVAAHLTARLLGQFSYKAVALDDALSEKIFDRYLKVLDAEKVFFVQADIDQMADARTRLDDALRTMDLDLPFAIFNRYTRRVADRFGYARSLLEKGFDFQQNESYRYQREKEPWPASEADMRELWRKRVKNDWLALKLAGKDDQKIRETLDKRYENFVKRIGKLRSEDAFQIFMNAYTSAVEPHTNYLGPRASEDFDISMRLSLVGIGATLQDKDDYTTIRELVPGGPAALSGKLKPGDRILGVGQGEQGPMVDVVGWRLDDTVALIRGAADSVVQLDILPAGAGPDGKHELVSLVRKKITLEEQAAKKSIISATIGSTTQRIGVIALPTFYEDFEGRRRGDRDYKSAARDVARLLKELKADKVDGVLIDLRNNGGGSMTEAIDLAGLFIDTGPVVQQRDANGRVSVGSDTNPGVAWEGPLGVLINRGSASASEIFAAAMQDYRRGLVIGEPSFGKGTVQSLIDLNRWTRPGQPPLGEVKLTIAQFFRIDGSTTQLRGVQPDIRLPVLSDPEHYGESSYDNALPWMRVGSADYTMAADFSDLLPVLQQRHDKRVAANKDYRYLLEDVAEFDVRRKKNEISLNEAERRKERDSLDARTKARGTVAAANKAPAAAGAAPGDTAVAANDSGNDDGEEEAAKASKSARDLLLGEAAHILGDATDLLKNRPAVASRNLPEGLSATR